ncbi:amidohydrolase family protein [Peterkaempfera bronchialis]|uniref:Cytosine deaminase n=1 Tax=Peterkaempfera bronchialis TaxID=2126346 RepID=A0A345SRA1_9ACTN|nr:amidohydrolase family protein [Peterkaempfera bronchialis]AXI76256.1 cytosine deaminase [Peterkaempfera bronchialis]
MHSTPSHPTVLADVTLPDGRRADVSLRDGLVAAVHERPSPTEAATARAEEADGADGADGRRLYLAGALLLPALVDGHTHLDKTFLGAPWQPHQAGGTIRERVTAELDIRRRLTVPVAERALALVHRMVGHGTGHTRSHVDIDPQSGLAGLHALLEVRERVRELMTVQIVAFPQSGVVTAPGVPALLDAALRDGADLVGGLDPHGFDGDIDGQLDIVFGLAERHGVGVDLHLHDPREVGAAQLRDIAARTAALGLGGRVTVSHAYCLGDIDDATFARTASALAEAGVSILTNGPAGPMPPVLRLREAGVRVFAGSDNIRDAWWPYGTGDMLERATVIGLRSELMTDDELHLAASLVTTEAAAALGLDRYGLRPGDRADLVAVAAGSVAEAVAAHPRRLLVMHAGRVVATDGCPVPGLPTPEPGIERAW